MQSIIFILETSRKESRNGIKYQNLLYGQDPETTRRHAG